MATRTGLGAVRPVSGEVGSDGEGGVVSDQTDGLLWRLTEKGQNYITEYALHFLTFSFSFVLFLFLCFLCFVAGPVPL